VKTSLGSPLDVNRIGVLEVKPHGEKPRGRPSRDSKWIEQAECTFP
jgi:hypothetical protein